MVQRGRGMEWPTFGLIAVIYGGWFGATFAHAAIPPVLLFPLGGWLVAWHSSLQHELMHGHPTRLRWLNRLFGLWPALPHLPFDRYARLHLLHHRDEHLTDPLEDPESQYWTPPAFFGLGSGGRIVVQLMTRVMGRLLVGPVWVVIRFVRREAERVIANDPGARRAWALHGVLLVLMAVWLTLVCRMPLLEYAVYFWLPGMMLLLLRSLAEHRAATDVDHRTAIVENAPLLGLLYLYNNLHAAHHARPGLPWYSIPAWYRHERERIVARNGGLVYDGYWDVVRRYLLAPHDRVVHPHYAPGRERQSAFSRP